MDDTHSLIAIQGPNADVLLQRTLRAGTNAFAMQDFMFSSFDSHNFLSKPLIIFRGGYTGEDGFEVSVPNERIETFMETMMGQINPASNEFYAMHVGLAARDSLRLEAGLCLYGHDITEEVSPIEATLAWTISKRRREEGGFIGYEKVKDHLENGVSKKRVGFVA